MTYLDLLPPNDYGVLLPSLTFDGPSRGHHATTRRAADGSAPRHVSPTEVAVKRPLWSSDMRLRGMTVATRRPSAGGLEIVLEYRPELFTAAEATGIADRLREVLEAIAARPDAPVATLPSASHAERTPVLGRWNDTARPDGPLLPELFDQQVRAHPDRFAIVCGEDVRTFAEAGRLASALVAHGAEAVVACGWSGRWLADASPVRASIKDAPRRG